jgi:hypothetical protein
VDAGKVWEEVEEQFVPKTGARMGERVVYFYLLRITRLRGKRELLTSIGDLAKAVCLCKTVARTAVRWLARQRAVRIVGRGRAGHRIAVRLPAEIPGCVGDAAAARKGVANIGDWDSKRAGRQAIFEREGHRCFYCLRQLGTRTRTLDHVVPLSRGGWNGYRNVVACCPACNEMKGRRSAEDLLRRLHRDGLLGRREFYRRLEALRELRRGVFRPRLEKAA